MTIKNFSLALTMLVVPLFAQGPGFGPGPGRTPVTQPPTEEEVGVLTWMREEEKLARDVYRFLNERWNLRVFASIAESEQQHFTAVGNLLARYKITDPVVSDTPGVYANETFTRLYIELTAKGSASMKDAMEVGVLIEKTDIADLERSLPKTNKYDIKRVFTNLMMASYNHLEAFEFNLEILGE